jgi:hypothetical protein
MQSVKNRRLPSAAIGIGYIGKITPVVSLENRIADLIMPYWVGLVKKLRAPNSYRAPHQPRPIAQKIRNIKYAG